MLTSSQFKAVIFDCFGVLYGGSSNALLARCAPENIQELIDINKQVDYGYISQADYVAGLARLLGQTPQEIKDFISQKHIRNHQLVEFLASLQPRFKVGLLSNVGRGGLDHLFSAEERAELFNAAVLSFEENLTKPHPHIFQLTAERLGVRPDQCIMIDDLAANCEGAKVAGLSAIQHVNNQLTIAQFNELVGDA